MLKELNIRRRLNLPDIFRGLCLKGEVEKSRSPFEPEFIQTRLLAPGALDGLNEDARLVLYIAADTGLRLSEAVNSLDLPPDEQRAIVHQSLTDHYRKTLDEPIPSLDNQSPRKAVKTAKGRKKVIAWLKMLENHSARQGPDDPMGSYDFTWMWQELGLGDERR
jgi:hypothetical protein